MSNYWSEELLRPAFVEDDVWHTILNNFLTSVSADPVSNLPSTLAEDIARLQSAGISEPSDLAALHYDMQQAGDFGSLTERGKMGSLGQGWSSLADIKLLIAEDGSKTLSGYIDSGSLSALDATRTAQYSISLPLNVGVDQQGFLDSVSTGR
ncbi:MAG: hypothetical protein JKY71_07155 [Alphaproteobacteria bacterium]|nr:hypothetical protein [Alphaproteobacteria bacterium]